jgi:hypothetical protein
LRKVVTAPGLPFQQNENGMLERHNGDPRE